MDRSRFHRIGRVQRAIFGLTSACIAVLLGISAHSQGMANNSAQASQENVVASNHFYNVVAGAQRPNGTTSAEKLAIDLRDMLNSPDSVKAIEQFNNAAGKYNGVDSELGFQPFEAGQGCNDCGKLTSSIQGSLTEIKNGHLSKLIQPTTTKLKTGLRLTPAGMPVWLALILGYNVVGGFALGAAYVIDKKRYRYDAYDRLDWRFGSKFNLDKLGCHVLFPGLVASWPYCAKQANKYQANQPVAEALKEAQYELDRLLRMPHDAQEVPAIKSAISDLRQMVSYLSEQPDERRRRDNVTRYTSVAKEAQGNLAAIRESVEAHDAADRELSGEIQMPSPISLDDRRQRRQVEG